MNVLHVLPRLTGAGPARTLVSLVKAQRRLGLPHRHRLVTLKRPAYPPLLLQAKQAGLEIVREPDRARLARELASADVAIVHFWNTPELYAALQEALPPARIVLWLKILGDRAPQAVTLPVVEFADWCIATGAATLALPALQGVSLAGRAGVIPPVPDYARLAGVEPRPHSTFNVGYIGTVNANKLHPRFVPLCAAVRVPEVRFIVCGGGEEAIAAQAAAMGVRGRFQLLGYVEDVAGVLEALDVFGYPLAPGNYSTIDLALVEAMYAAVPPVIFPHGGITSLVQDGETGLVARSEAEYVEAIQFLYENPSERRRLGRNARERIRAYYSDEGVARDFDTAFANAMTVPARERPPLFPEYSPARLFAATLGDAEAPFAGSLGGDDEQADARIADSPTILAAGEGGILHYRNAFPDDPFLRFWSGLVLQRRGRVEAAATEFRAAAELGMEAARVRRWVAHGPSRVAVSGPLEA